MLWLSLLTLVGVSVSSSPPNIVIIVADDLGHADVSFNGGIIPTPHLDSLASRGVIMDNYYTHPVCTPSRAALLTGRYGHSVGLPGALLGANICGLPNDTSTLAEELRQRGYATHLVGKWHLGFSKLSFTPLERGFDTHYGCYGAAVAHWTKFMWNYYDFRNNKEGLYDPNNTHSSKMLATESVRVIENHASHNKDRPMFMLMSLLAAHAPLQADEDHLAPCSHIKPEIRRLYCGLVVSIDQSVKVLTDALTKYGMIDNTIIIFTTDNGGMPHEGGLSYPYRGAKASLFDGGMRGPAFITAPAGWLKRTSYRYQGLVHIADWFPTLLHLADHADEMNDESHIVPRVYGRPQKPVTYQLDGHNIWHALSKNGSSPRSEVVGSIDRFGFWGPEAAYRKGKWKIVVGFPHDPQWYTEPVRWAIPNPNLLDYVIEIAESAALFLFGLDKGYFWQEFLNELRLGLNFKYQWNHGSPNSSSVREGVGVEGVDVKHKWLFDIEADPSEKNNLYEQFPEIAKEMEQHVEKIRANLGPQCDWGMVHKYHFTNDDPKHPDKLFISPWLSEEVDPASLVLTDLRYWGLNKFLGFMKLLGIGVSVFTVITFFLLYCICRRRKKQKRKPE